MDAIISLTQWERQINVFSGTENCANDKHHDIYSLGIPEYRATSGKILIENSLLKICNELVNCTISKGNDDVHCCNCIRMSKFDFQHWNQSNFVPLVYT